MDSSYVCVDAKLVIRLVADPADEPIQYLWEQWDSERRQLAAPTLLYYEVAKALYRYQQLGYLTAPSVQLAFGAALALPLELHGEPDLHWRALELAAKFSLPAACDAHYLALAELLEGEFWTADGRLARTVRSSLPWVHLVE
ncbi:MAG TPA: type II toxin-antitoxin system VapC family toxin [Anaerolineae bacterium]|nr:type II toxin-antitoxin system VapC family toxin [Anaerolineae bacterium]